MRRTGSERAVIAKDGDLRLTNHLFTHASGKPGCIYCLSLVTKRIGGWRGREALEKAARARELPPGATAFECRACYRVFVAINDPSSPSGVLR